VTRARFRLRAIQDLAENGEWIAADNPDRAETFVEELEQRCLAIMAFPLSGRSRPDFGEGVRSIAYGDYLIFSLPRARNVDVLRIVHAARNLRRL